MGDGNAERFGALLIELLRAAESPSDGVARRIDALLDAIRANGAAAYAVAAAIAQNWQTVYANPSYRLRLFDGGERATALESSALAGCDRHAFVVLGCALEDGRMTDELRRRCDAAAAAARSFPGAILVCSGGATGDNNPRRHTEAGLMRDCLSQACGIDAARIFVDERAMTTLDNAVNTFAILEAQGVETYTIVTSTYHQRRSQAIYSAMAALCRADHGYVARIVENYCVDCPPPEHYGRDDQIAVRQLAALLDLPNDVVEAIEAAF